MNATCNHRTALAMLLAVALPLVIGCERKDIYGLVQDPFGNGLDSVSVQVVKSAFTSSTNDKGEYAIDYVPGAFALKFSKPGYTTMSLELTIQQKMRFPAEAVVMYPMPQETGFYYVGEKGLLKLEGSGIRAAQWQTGWMSHQNNYYVATAANIVIPPGRARFIDKTPQSFKPARLTDDHLIQAFQSSLGIQYIYNGVIEREEQQRFGEEQLLIRSFEVTPGNYAWVEMAQMLFGGARPNENGWSYPFRVEVAASDSSISAQNP